MYSARPLHGDQECSVILTGPCLIAKNPSKDEFVETKLANRAYREQRIVDTALGSTIWGIIVGLNLWAIF